MSISDVSILSASQVEINANMVSATNHLDISKYNLFMEATQWTFT